VTDEKSPVDTNNSQNDPSGRRLQLRLNRRPGGTGGGQGTPGMYIGSTGPRGLHHLVWEIVDNAVDEALAGYCKKIDISINEDDSVTVEDDGRGIPTGIVEKPARSAIETVLPCCTPAASSAVALQVSVACMEWVRRCERTVERLDVEVYRDGKIYHQIYRRGLLMDLGHYRYYDKRGTKVTFWPDHEFFMTSTRKTSGAHHSSITTPCKLVA